MNILGINAYHGDAAVALVQNGQLVAAVEEERFTRVKHWAGFPSQAICYCLQVGGISAREIDHVALSYNPKANLNRKLLFTPSAPTFHTLWAISTTPLPFTLVSPLTATNTKLWD